MISFKAILGFLFVLLVAAIAVLGVISYRNNEDAVHAADSVNHTHHVIEMLDEIRSNYKDIRLGAHAALAGNGSPYQERYSRTKAALFSHVKDVKRLTRDNAEQQQRIDSLESAIRQWTGLSDSVMAAAAIVPGNARNALYESYNESILTGMILLKIRRIKAAEEILLQQRELATRDSVAAFKQAFVLLLAAIAILLGATFLVVRYNFNKRQHIQEELRSSNALFEKVFYESPIAMVISEFDTGKIFNCNRVFAGMVNYKIAELIGKTTTELGIFESRAQGIEGVAGVKGKSTALGGQVEAFIHPRDKAAIYGSIHAHLIPLYDRRCLLTAILDLSTHKKAEEGIKKALEAEIELNKLKSNLVTLASHEFRTPLTTILSSAFLMEHYVSGENQDKARRHLARIKSSVNNLTSILDEFLSVTKIEEGRVQASFERLDLPNHIENICSNLRAFTKPGQTIHYSHSGEHEVKTDPVLLGSIVNNLVTNSIKYSPDNSPIYVSSVVNGKIQLTVTDKGIGIPPEDQKHLFGRFYRASNAGAVQGTGLGLHIMKHYVGMLNGSVKLESELGKGTRVEVTLDQS
jgi:signal transduction histidine kinase/CHASE3 domain sensor protein